MAQPISEKDGVHKAWYDEAKTITVDTLGDFVRRLTTDYGHDYGTICHAVAASMCAAMSAVNDSPAGGITGFQAGCIKWSVLEHAFYLRGPARLVEYSDLLYPQYESRFRSITPETWEHIRKLAQEELTKNNGRMHPNVRAHIESIAERGKVPFGLRVEES